MAKGTVAIAGDSTIFEISEDLLIINRYKVKVRFLRGGTVEDMTNTIKPLLK